MPSSEPDSCSSPGSQRTASPASIDSRSAVASADPPGPAHDGEELRPDSRVPGDDAFRADLDHDDVRVAGQAPSPGR